MGVLQLFGDTKAAATVDSNDMTSIKVWLAYDYCKYIGN